MISKLLTVMLCLFSEKSNGSFHQALNLSIPDNIMLLFQPPYTPQVNPIERLWKEIKKFIKWDIFADL
jgi:transposase